MSAATLDLFSDTATTSAFVEDYAADNQEALSKVSGLIHIPNFVSEDVEQKILAALNKEPWIGDLERRVQHYGYRYNYKSAELTNQCVWVNCRLGLLISATRWPTVAFLR